MEHFAISGCKLWGFDSLIKRLPNLKSLVVARYNYEETFHMDEIANLKLLEYLDLSDNENVCDGLLRDIVENCPNLKFLDIRGTDLDERDEENLDISGIGALRNLTSLNLSGMKDFENKAFRNYAAASPPVENLYLVGCSQLTDDDLKWILTSCRRLKHLDLSGCSKVTEATLVTAIEILKSRINKQPLQIVVGGTEIKEPVQKKKDNGNECSAISHELLTINYEDSREKEWKKTEEEEADFDIDDWTHLMKGVGDSFYYNSDGDDSDLSPISNSDSDEDIDPRTGSYNSFSNPFF